MNPDAIRKIAAKLLVLIAVVLLCWPAVSHVFAYRQVLREMEQYSQAADSLEEADYSRLIQEARAYNDALTRFSPTLSEKRMKEYQSLMNIAGTGVMGRISIPKIHVDLPIYHGATDEVIKIAAGHIPGSSLPVVSQSSHVVITSHSGLATAALFTELDQLEIGDRFQISALRQTLCYEVDQIRTVLPEEIDSITIEPGKEYCTLVTCTPIGINNRRLLVRGHRIPGEEGENEASADSGLMKALLGGKILAAYEIAMLGIALILFLWSFILPGVKALCGKIKKENTKRKKIKIE